MGLFSGRLIAKGAEAVRGKNIWLDNDDLRPLALKDRTWTGYTYFTFWFSAAATGMLVTAGPYKQMLIGLQSATGMEPALLKPWV